MQPAHRSTRRQFGILPDGRAVDIITLTNAAGAVLEVLTYGAVIRSLRVPDRSGVLDDVVLGYDTLAAYCADRCFVGATVGRFANRISNARFVLDGRVVELSSNDPPHQLHGGAGGFYAQLWHAEVLDCADGAAVRLSRVSPHGEEGYPGNVEVEARYTLTDANELVVDYFAVTDRASPVNLSQHSYFNLAAGQRGTIHQHELRLDAVGFLPTDETGIPLEHIEPAEGPFDFSRAVPIGAHLSAEHEQLRRAAGFDHCFVLRRGDSGPCIAAELYAPASGRTMTVLTTEPAVQFYTGQHLTDALTGAPTPHRGLCLETQHYPDSPNRPEFPSTILRPGAEYRSRTGFRFGVRD